MIIQSFTATKSGDRERLGERVTDWLRAHGELEVVGKHVRQSSDHEYHCLSIVLELREREAKAPRRSRR